MTKNASKQYLLIVQVFEDAKNAMSFVYDSKENFENFKYEYIDGKYYVYAFSSVDRKDIEMFRAAYEKECWIKNPTK